MNILKNTFTLFFAFASIYCLYYVFTAQSNAFKSDVFLIGFICIIIASAIFIPKTKRD